MRYRAKNGSRRVKPNLLRGGAAMAEPIKTPLGVFEPFGDPAAGWYCENSPVKLYGQPVRLCIMGRSPGETELGWIERFIREQDAFKVALANVLRFGPLADYADPDKLLS